MNIFQSNISTTYSLPISYERPFNTGNKIVDVIMRNHNWNGAIGMPLEIKYTYANIDNIDEYLTYKDSFIFAMDCTYTPAYNTLAQISDPELQKLSMFFGTQRSVHENNYETNRDLGTDFLYYAEDTHHSTQQGSFESSKQQCEYKKQLLQENFKRLAYCHPEIIKAEGIDPLTFIKDVNKLLPMKPEKYTEIYAKTRKFAIEHKSYALLERMKAPQSSHINMIDESLTKIFHILSDVAAVKMIRTDKIYEAKVFFHFNLASHAEAIRDITFFNQHKTDAAFLEGLLFENSLINSNSENLKEVWHTVAHAFIDHPMDNNMYHSLNAQEKSAFKCSSVLYYCNLDPISLMPYDIMALQHMYTANIHSRAGDTVYKIYANQTYFDEDQAYLPFSIPEGSIYTLYDAGGKNTLDTRVADDIVVRLDLNEGTGHLNEVGNNKFLLAFGTNIHKIELGGIKPQVTLHSTIGCEIIIQNGVQDAKIINFHAGQDEIFFGTDVVNISNDYGFTAYDPLGAIIADVYYD